MYELTTLLDGLLKWSKMLNDNRREMIGAGLRFFHFDNQIGICLHCVSK